MSKGAAVRESVMRFGPQGELVGILSEPASPRDPGRMLILLNSGAMHRVGSCRISVKIARAAAARSGIAALRFDFSGIGDSVTRPGGPRFEESAVADLLDVMNRLQHERGVARFAVYGLCSGADIAMHAGSIDPRIVEVIQIDGYCFPTWRSRLRYYLLRVKSADRVMAFLRRIFGLRTVPRSGAQIADIDQRFFEVPVDPDPIGRGAVAAQLRALAGRGVRLLCFFTGREPAFNYPRQFEDCFSDVDFAGLLQVVHLPDSRHILSDPAAQAIVPERIANWLSAAGIPGDVPNKPANGGGT